MTQLFRTSLTRHYVGVCSYYELKLAPTRGSLVAQSAGDLQSAPYPDGATEFVDLHREEAEAHGIRYAVMVINAYAGLPFSRLDRAFAGIMLRDDPEGVHFDPRTVKLRFGLRGEKGVYLPIVLDLDTDTAHWLDTYSKGEFQYNNVATSNSAIQKICPEMITYFASGVRMSMYELGLLHAAARAPRVLVRREGAVSEFVLKDGENSAEFLERLRQGDRDGEQLALQVLEGRSPLALLHTGDVELPEGSTCYALFRGSVSQTLIASDLLSGRALPATSSARIGP